MKHGQDHPHTCLHTYVALRSPDQPVVVVGSGCSGGSGRGSGGGGGGGGRLWRVVVGAGWKLW